MADTKTPAEHSENMSRIRSTNTKPEEIVRKYLFSHGFRYRKNDKRYPGRPEILSCQNTTLSFLSTDASGICMVAPAPDFLVPIKNTGSPKLNETSSGMQKINKNWRLTVGR